MKNVAGNGDELGGLIIQCVRLDLSSCCLMMTMTQSLQILVSKCLNVAMDNKTIEF